MKSVVLLLASIVMTVTCQITCNPPGIPPPQPCDYNPCENFEKCTNVECSYVCTCLPGWNGTTCTECDPLSADVTFILDVSYSTGDTILQQQKQFIIDFVNRVDIGPDDIQIAVVMYSFTAISPLLLNHYDNKSELIDAINALQYPAHIGPSYLDTGLKATGDWVFASGNGSRSDVYKYVLVLTDGLATDMTKAEMQSQLLQIMFLSVSVDFKVIAIATGPQILHNRLLSIVNDRSPQNVYYSVNNDVHGRIIHDLDTGSCRDCVLESSDILILFDSSYVRDSPIIKQKNVVDSLIGALNMSLGGVRVGFIQFTNDTVEEISKFNEYTTQGSLKIRINDALNYGGASGFKSVLTYASEEGFLEAKGSRSDTRHIVIVVSSANFDISATEIEMMKEMKDEGVIFVAIATGTRSNITNMQKIASDPGFIFLIGSNAYTSDSDVKSLVSLTQFYTCN